MSDDFSYYQQRVLALSISTKGFGFIVCEGPLEPVEFGMKQARGTQSVRDRAYLEKVMVLLSLYSPAVIVLEDCWAPGCRKGARSKKLIEKIAHFVEAQGIRTVRYSRDRVRRCFSRVGATTRQQIAEAIATHYVPELRPRVPRARKLWQTESSRMGIFDAAALTITFFMAYAEPIDTLEL